MIFEFNIPLPFIVLLALFAWILFSISRRRKHASLFWVTWNVELLWDNLVITVCAQNAKWLANRNYRIFKILFRKMKQWSYWGPRWVAAHDMEEDKERRDKTSSWGSPILTLLLHWTIYFEKAIKQVVSISIRIELEYTWFLKVPHIIVSQSVKAPVGERRRH